jgi:rhamnulose-1-phosphate aldolase
MEDIECVKGFIRMCFDGYQFGWHERNGGNLTYRMKKEEIEEAKLNFYTPREWIPIGVQADNLKNEYFITTGSGKFMRNVYLNPADNIGIVEINDAGDSYRTVWGLNNNAVPTSEFPSHFLNHSVRKNITDEQNRVIYHCHATNIIALSFILPLTDKDFTRVLWKSMTECPVIFPQGIGVVPWMVPGGSAIAEATSDLMKKYSAAIWAHHGLFVSGPDFDTAFGLAHTIEKSAEIYLKILSSGKEIRQTITDEELLSIEPEFHVHLNREFLEISDAENHDLISKNNSDKI